MAALKIANVEEALWDDAADVVVVGYGGAGASAALQARESGADVMLIDRFGGGGTTAYSGGVIYAGATRYLKEAGYDETPEDMLAYLELEVGDAVRPETLRRFCENSAGDIDWLVGYGVKYASDVYEEKVTFPPEGKYLYYSGNEKAPAFAAKAKPAPRGHRAVGPGYGGQHYVAALSKSIDRAGIRVRRHARVMRLVVDERGSVAGVEALVLPESKHADHQRLYDMGSPWLPHANKRKDQAARAIDALERAEGKTMLIRARGGVVLSTGSFAYNPDLVGKQDANLGKNYGVLHRLSTLGNDGGGIELGQSAGGAVDRMDSFYIARNIAPPSALLEGVLVNREGRRFVNEDAYTAFVGGAISRQTDAAAWLMLPENKYRRAIVECMTCGWHRFKFFGAPTLINFFLGGTKHARSIEAIAKKCGVDPAGLRATFETNDRAVREGAPDPGGKNADYAATLGDGPFAAVNMSISNAHALTPFMTLGGLKVDEDTGAVLRADGQAIDGVYAAGLCAVGLHSNGYISGISLADGVFSGRRAGRASAAAAKRRAAAAQQPAA